ncbi:oleandomycin transport system ATP-binding protein [Nonomuraea solani]|uniref:Oleandomycin transport system ATP-binding protein n=1 Tax=Nonomuraea solani TaxID=1144553 RepID=A0A1H6AY20_9ACTN|nr:oleandomycin transport system ATP-binding protein [Nonomuraea solani]
MKDAIEAEGLVKRYGDKVALDGIDLAVSLVGRPRILFLDEPTTGLDPHARGELWTVVRELTADGVTVLLTTQYLEEADQHMSHPALPPFEEGQAGGPPRNAGSEVVRRADAVADPDARRLEA